MSKSVVLSLRLDSVDMQQVVDKQKTSCRTTYADALKSFTSDKVLCKQDAQEDSATQDNSEKGCRPAKVESKGGNNQKPENVIDGFWLKT